MLFIEHISPSQFLDVVFIKIAQSILQYVLGLILQSAIYPTNRLSVVAV